MSHPPQPTYGRPAYTYGGPPPQQQPQYGYPSQTPQPDTRYYSPGPQQQQEQQYPPQNGPQPFYFIPPSQQQQMAQQPPQSQQQPQRISPKPTTTQDDLYAAPPQRTNTMGSIGRPQTMYAGGSSAVGISQSGSGSVQELATGSFDSPIDNRQSYVGQSPPQQAYQQGGYTPEGHAPQQGRPQSPYSMTSQQQKQQQQPIQQLPPSIAAQKPSAISTLPSQQHQQFQPQPSDPYANPYTTSPQLSASRPPMPSNAPPSVPQEGSPVMQQSGYPPGAPSGYQAYGPVGGQGQQGAQQRISRYGYNPPAAATAVGEAEGFYR